MWQKQEQALQKHYKVNISSPTDKVPAATDLMQEHLPGVDGKNFYDQLQKWLGPKTRLVSNSPHGGGRRRFDVRTVEAMKDISISVGGSYYGRAFIDYSGDNIRIDVEQHNAVGSAWNGDPETENVSTWEDTWILTPAGVLSGEFLGRSTTAGVSNKSLDKPTVPLRLVFENLSRYLKPITTPEGVAKNARDDVQQTLSNPTP